jgi:long-chain fatty acid transport protein
VPPYIVTFHQDPRNPRQASTGNESQKKIIKRRKNMQSVRFLCALVGIAAVGASHANMGNIATSYGVLPTDVGSAQALSLFNTKVSATYYNPSQLTRDKRGELTGALLHGEHDLKAISRGGANPPVREGDTLMNTPSQHVLIGMKTDLTSLTRYERPLYFALLAGVEKFGGEMMAFSSETSLEGQYLRYGRQPLFLNMGGALEVMPGWDVGASARITLHSEASLVTIAETDGQTDMENLNVSAVPSIRPILGTSFDLGKLFCGESCWLSGFEAALAFRGYSNSNTRVVASTVIPGTIDEPGLTLSIATLDAWQPDIFVAGVQYRRDNWRVGLTLEQQNWSALGREFESDTIKDQAQLEFDDVLIPRLGAEIRVARNYIFTTGIALEKSPLKGRESLNVNYFDNDRAVFGVGMAVELPRPPIMAYPVRLDFGYQYQQLKARDFDLTADDAPDNPYETVTAKGEVHVFSGSITLKF